MPRNGRGHLTKSLTRNCRGARSYLANSPRLFVFASSALWSLLWLASCSRCLSSCSRCLSSWSVANSRSWAWVTGWWSAAAAATGTERMHIATTRTCGGGVNDILAKTLRVLTTLFVKPTSIHRHVLAGLDLFRSASALREIKQALPRSSPRALPGAPLNKRGVTVHSEEATTKSTAFINSGYSTVLANATDHRQFPLGSLTGSATHYTK